jgi:predicted nucleic acid-binding protein
MPTSRRTDANIVINFIHAGMLGDLPGMVDMDFLVVDEVYEEITRPEQRQALDAALTAGAWTRESLIEPQAIEVFADLAVKMGRGEAASLALAVTRGCLVASDERKVFLREASQRLGEGRIHELARIRPPRRGQVRPARSLVVLGQPAPRGRFEVAGGAVLTMSGLGSITNAPSGAKGGCLHAREC